MGRETGPAGRDPAVLFAAGFNGKSAAARILAAVREGNFQLVWNKPTRRETETILRRIPGLDWAGVVDLFRPEGEFTGPVDPDAFVMIADRDDRKIRSAERSRENSPRNQ